MNFVVLGFGRVGSRTARILESEGHAVVVVERDPAKVADAREAGFDVVEGDAQSESILDRVGLEEADALGALTGDLNANFAACMIAKSAGCRTVLRIDEDYREEIYATYAEDVDEIVYPERLGAAGAKNALLGGDLTVLADLTESLTATALTVEPDATVIGQRVVEVDLPEGARLYAHGHENEPMTIPLPQTVIEAGDQVAFVATREALPALSEQFTGA